MSFIFSDENGDVKGTIAEKAIGLLNSSQINFRVVHSSTSERAAAYLIEVNRGDPNIAPNPKTVGYGLNIDTQASTSAPTTIHTFPDRIVKQSIF